MSDPLPPEAPMKEKQEKSSAFRGGPRSRSANSGLTSQQQEPQTRIYGPPCTHCGKPLAGSHGRFARCVGGETQFTAREDAS